MKKLLIIASAILLAVSCGPKGNAYMIKGTVDGPVASDSAAKVVLYHQDGTTEECPIVKGAFSFTGEATDEEIWRLGVTTDGTAESGYKAMLIPQKGVIRAVLSEEESTVTGGRLNKALKEYTGQIQDALDDFERTMDAIADSLGRDAAMEKLVEMNDVVTGKIVDISKSAFAANKDNAVGFDALMNMIQDISLAELDECLDGAADFIKENKTVVAVRESLVAVEQTAEGTMFKDFSGKTPNGKDVRLSDYVGKGKYTLVDFWASWCGPCKREIPNIREIFEKYGKKLNVVGVAVWDGDNSGSRKVMEDLGMKWNQIFVGEDKTPTDIYGIVGIPHIILFGPDGTILKRNLRGEEMIEAVKSVME